MPKESKLTPEERIARINLPDHITEIYSVYRTHS